MDTGVVFGIVIIGNVVSYVVGYVVVHCVDVVDVGVGCVAVRMIGVRGSSVGVVFSIVVDDGGVIDGIVGYDVTMHVHCPYSHERCTYLSYQRVCNGYTSRSDSVL